MALSNPVGVVFSYNGFTFPSNVKTKMVEEPVTSGDNRVVKYSKCTISCTGYITQQDTGYFYSKIELGITDGGAGYVVGDVLLGTGGTFTTAISVTVAAVDGAGTVLIVTTLGSGVYSAPTPTNPMSFDGGSGAGFKAGISWGQYLWPLDTAMKSIRRKLHVNGKTLRYVNKGYGADLTINQEAGVISAASQRDVAFGPKPGRFTWVPLGGAPDGCHAAMFDWEVVFHIAECDNFRIAPGVFIEVWFTVTYDVDEAGLVVITHHGNAQIPMSLRANNRLDWNIELSLNQIMRAVPVGFLRKHSRQLSADRANCSFTITDRQIEIPYPEDVVHIDFKHRVRQRGKMSPVWDVTFTSTIRMSPTASKLLAYVRFWNIVAQRVRHMRLPGFFSRAPTVVPGVFEAEEDCFKNESRFTFTCMLVGVFLEQLARKSGLWQPFIINVAPAYEEAWDAEKNRNSLATNAQRFRGILDARFDNDDEIIIDVCTGPVPPVTSVSPAPRIQTSSVQMTESMERTDENRFLPVPDLLPGITSPGAVRGEIQSDMDADDQFAPETSWIDWNCTVETDVDNRYIRHKPLAGTVTMDTPSVDPFGLVKAVADDIRKPGYGFTATVEDIFQQTSAPSITVTLRGYGIRIGHRVKAPDVLPTTFQGRNVVVQRRKTPERYLAYSAGVVVYRTDWEIILLVSGAPHASVPLPANPMLGVNGIGGVASSPAFLNPLKI